MKIYTDSDNEKVVTNNTIAKLDKDSELEFVKFEENQHLHNHLLILQKRL